jgi:thiol-disulfide isomerase/thioredoxin
MARLETLPITRIEDCRSAMPFPILLGATAATWWNFTNDEFEEKKAHSLEKPVFVVCYSRWCPHCFGFPEATRDS